MACVSPPPLSPPSHPLPTKKDDNFTQSYLTTMNITLDQSLHTFTQKTHAALASIGKTPVVWQEMALAHDEVKLRNETLVITWISSEDAYVLSLLFAWSTG